MKESNGLIGKFEFNGKTINFPAYFPQISRAYDLSDTLNVMSKLENAGEKNPLQNTRGIIIEMQKCRTVGLESQIIDRNQKKLFGRENGGKFSSFYQFIEQYNIPFFIDPNLDRLNRNGYLEHFKMVDGTKTRGLKQTGILFTKDFASLLKGQTKDFNPNWFKNPEFIRKNLEYQIKLGVTEIIAPYVAFDILKFSETLSLNAQLYKDALDLSKTIFKRETPVLPIISIRKNVLKAKPKYWDSIIEFYKSTGAKLLILKLSDFNTLSNDEPYQELSKFFEQFRQNVEDPIILLNINEFAYILFGKGLQIYSAMMSRSGMESGGGQNMPDVDRSENKFGKYYVPRELCLAKRKDMQILKCHCLMCASQLTKFKDLGDAEWNTLRIGHFLITKNNEIEHIKTEIKKSSLRAALKDMFADSKNWKNFTGYC